MPQVKKHGRTIITTTTHPHPSYTYTFSRPPTLLPTPQVKKRRAVEDSNAENRMLFFAKVLRSATEDEVRALFANYGRVYDVNLFRAFQGAPTTKVRDYVSGGCRFEPCRGHTQLFADGSNSTHAEQHSRLSGWIERQRQCRRHAGRSYGLCMQECKSAACCRCCCHMLHAPMGTCGCCSQPQRSVCLHLFTH